MLPKAAPSIYQVPKCFVTYGSMGHTDVKQLPRRSKPWSNLMALDFIHKVDLVMPQEIYETLCRQLVQENSPPCYYKIIMSLEQILQGAFFNEYIKRGNILMLSEGTPTIDNTFMLREGVLTMYLDKETYERAGLAGRPQGAKGNRGLKPRWIVSYDLRNPSMLHGKRGFDRLLFASKKVLNQSLTWLFCNVAESSPAPDPLQQHSPTKFTSAPGVVENIAVTAAAVSVPSPILVEGNRTDFEITASELHEWFSLIRLGSPRVKASDNIDPYLSRYQVPGEASGQWKVCKVSWQGFISTQWVRELLATLITTCPPQAWFFLDATEFSKGIPATGNELTLLRPPDATDEYLMWEVKNP